MVQYLLLEISVEMTLHSVKPFSTLESENPICEKPISYLQSRVKLRMYRQCKNGEMLGLIKHILVKQIYIGIDLIYSLLDHGGDILKQFHYKVVKCGTSHQ